MRKIIQIAVNGRDTHALCDDGTLWSFEDGEWRRAPDIPQDDDPELYSEIEPAPKPEGWRPWERSPDRMWCVDHTDEKVVEVPNVDVFKALAYSISCDDPKWTMVRAPHADFALSTWRDRSIMTNEVLVIGLVSYPYIVDTIPF